MRSETRVWRRHFGSSLWVLKSVLAADMQVRAGQDPCPKGLAGEAIRSRYVDSCNDSIYLVQ